MPEYMDTQPEIFRFEKENDSLEGKLVSVRDGKYPRIDAGGNMIGKSKIYTIESNSKLYTVFGSAVLENRMVQVKTGDSIKITFKGFVKNKRGQDMRSYEVLKATS